MKKEIEKFDGKESKINNVTKEVLHFVEIMERLAKENDYTLHCNNEVLERLKEVSDNLFITFNK